MQTKFSLSEGNPLLNITLGILLLLVAVWVLIIGKAIILPLLMALFLSFILDPIVNLLKKVHIPLAIAVPLTLLLAFVLLYLLGLLVYANVQSFVAQLPVYQARLVQTLNELVAGLEKLAGEQLNSELWKRINWLDTLQRYSIAQNILKSVGTFFTFFAKMVIVIVFIAYLLTGKRNVNDKIRAAFQPARAERFIQMIESIVGQVQKYLGAKTIASMFTGAVSLVIFWIFGIDFAVFWALIIFLFNFVPTIGSIIASLLPVLFSLLQTGSLPVAFWLAICLLILQLGTGNIIEPRIMGRSLNLSPMIVILSLIFWGYIWGVAGMILAVPIMATVTIVCENFPALRFVAVFLRGKIS